MTDETLAADPSVRSRIALRVVLAGVWGGAGFGIVFGVGSAIGNLTSPNPYVVLWFFVLPTVIVIAALGGLGSAATGLAVRAIVRRLSQLPIAHATAVATGAASFIVVGYLLVPGFSSTAPAVVAVAATLAAVGLGAITLVSSRREKVAA